VIVDLIETGLDAREREKRGFLELAERLANSSNTKPSKSASKKN
jgi:hypothetical protein